MSIFDDIPTRSNANSEFVEASWWNIIKTKLQQAFPNVTGITGNVVGTTDEQTLTNKTFDDEITLKELDATPTTPAVTYKKIYAKDDGKLYALDSDGNEKEIGSGVGVGGVNFFDSDSAFISDSIGSWATDDGSGGAATGLTLSVTDVVGEVIDGDGSLKIVKAAADHDGEFVKLGSETIAPAWRGKQMFGRIAIRPGTGYVSGDFRVQVWDLTNNAELYSGQSDDLEILNFSGIQFVNFTPYLESTTEEIEFRLVVNNTNTNGFDFFADLLTTGPASVLPAFNSTPWQPYTPTLSASLNATVDFAEWRRVGENMDVRGVITTGTPTAGVATISLANGKNSRVIPTMINIGNWRQAGNSIDDFTSGSFALGSNANFLTFTDDLSTAASSGSPSSPPNANVIFRSSSKVYFEFSVPIEGWQASSTMTTNELGLQKFKATVTGSTQSIPNNTHTKLTFDTAAYDKVGAVDLSNNRINILRDSSVQIVFNGVFAGNATGTRQITIYKNGTALTNGAFRFAALSNDTRRSLIYEDEFERDDYIEIYVLQSSGGNLNFSNARLTVKADEDLTLIGAVKGAGEGHAVGDIKQSMLTEAQFTALHGDTWVLMDGRSVAGSRYANITGNSSVPDARGRHLRSKSFGANSVTDWALGNVQADAVGGHTHPFSADSSFSASPATTSGGGTIIAGGGSPTQLGRRSIGGASLFTVNDAVLSNNGTNENRVKQVTVNTFIKIN